VQLVVKATAREKNYKWKSNDHTMAIKSTIKWQQQQPVATVACGAVNNGQQEGQQQQIKKFRYNNQVHHGTGSGSGRQNSAAHGVVKASAQAKSKIFLESQQ